MRDRGIVAVLLALGPDLTARQWARKLRTTPRKIREIAYRQRIPLADDPLMLAAQRAIDRIEAGHTGAAKWCLKNALEAYQE